jgi:hypothetical protein
MAELVEVKVTMKITSDNEDVLIWYESDNGWGSLHIDILDIERGRWNNFDEYLYENNKAYRYIAEAINVWVKESHSVEKFYRIMNDIFDKGRFTVII